MPVFDELNDAADFRKDEYRDDLNVKMICPECRIDPPNLVEDFSAGDTICGDCGIVLGARIIDSRSEWRTFANDESGGDDPSRVGKAQSAFEEGEGLETSVGFSEGSGSRELQRAQQKASGGKTDKYLNEGLGQVTSLCNALMVEQRITDSAKQIWQLIVKHPKTFRNKNTEALIAAAVFQGCRQQGVPRSFKEINMMAHVSKKEIGKAHRLLEAFLRQKKTKDEERGIQTMQNGMPTMAGYKADQGAASAADFVQRHSRTLNLPQKVTTIAKRILEKTDSLPKLVGRSPLTAAASSMYFAALLCGVDKHPKEFAVVCGISDGTIRSTYKNLYEAFINKEWALDDAWLQPPYSVDSSRLQAASTGSKQENVKAKDE